MDLHKLKGVTKTSSMRLFNEMDNYDFSHLLEAESASTAILELDSAVIDDLELEDSGHTESSDEE